ncbi:hypothetical protein Hanom_Chr05g00402961 [Helianthus anomalus]
MAITKLKLRMNIAKLMAMVLICAARTAHKQKINLLAAYHSNITKYIQIDGEPRQKAETIDD